MTARCDLCYGLIPSERHLIEVMRNHYETHEKKKCNSANCLIRGKYFRNVCIHQKSAIIASLSKVRTRHLIKYVDRMMIDSIKPIFLYFE